MREFKGYMHGINLGGWFSQCDHSEKRYDYFVRKDDFSRIARWGFDHVRIPVDYELILNEDLSFNEKGFKRLDDCISWCKDNSLNMVLDLHKTVGFSFDAGEQEEGFFDSARYQDIFCDIWSAFAKRYGQQKHVAFELLNEVSDPAYCDSWNRIIARTVSVIREHAPETKIIIGGYHNNSVEAIKDIAVPDDRNIVLNFHCYSPLVFTHQGAYWIPGMDRSFRMSFEQGYEEYRRLTKQQISPDHPDFFPEGNGKIDASYFEELFADALKIAEERNVLLYCGEYGVIDLADPQETLKWYRCIHEVFEKHGIARSAWSYREMDFGLSDSRMDGVRDELIRYL